MIGIRRTPRWLGCSVADLAITNWTMARAEPGALRTPSDLAGASLRWIDATSPGTAAGALRSAGQWVDTDVVDFDESDWWFHADFEAPGSACATLRFAGIATLAEVWVNDVAVLESDNMHLSHEVLVEPLAHNDVHVVCRSLNRHLAIKRTRPRWKTRLIERQQLRWVRTTLLGRMPSWTPPAAPVGLWQPVTVSFGAPGSLTDLLVRTALEDDIGTVSVSATVAGSHAVPSGDLWLDDVPTPIVAARDGERWHVTASGTVRNPRLWQVHTHGDPELYRVRLDLVVDDVAASHDLGSVGFRSVAVTAAEGVFAIAVNELPVFARGACWTPPDPIDLASSREDLRQALRLVADAGMNMVRMLGSTVYADDVLLSLCDELGLMVWHDFMFANMDYPVADPGFLASVSAEVDQFLRLAHRHPCVVVLCGGSEVEQQASMMGNSTFDNWLGRTFLPEQISRHGLSVGYVPCSPSGGVFPFTVDTGVSHYYGVGAYMRPLADARASGVRFTSECLAFSNVPCRESVDEFLPDGDRPGHSPRWKGRVPRDRGAGWDFEDVRDHYVGALLGCDPSGVRYADPDRYLDLGRAAVCVAVESTITELRRPGSTCRGALIFVLRDLWQGPGWGIIDSRGRPKSAYYAAKRSMSPVGVFAVDEGLNGLNAVVHNDRPSVLRTTLEVRLFAAAGAEIAHASTPIEIDAHTSRTLSVDALFDTFRDLTYSYRFGPSQLDTLSLRLVNADGTVLHECHYLPHGHQRAVDHSLVVDARGWHSKPRELMVKVRSNRFAQFVSIDVVGAIPEENWFHLCAGDERTIRCDVVSGDVPMTGEVRALNGATVTSFNFAGV
jgi:beta-mannosidase